MIAHVLHHIWLGPKPLPTGLIETWRDMHPDWELRLWREDNLRRFRLRNRRAFETYLRRRLWHGAANVARLEIVNRLGGVYVDMDTVPLRPFDGGRFMRAGLFAGYVQPREEYPGLIGNAYIGAEPGHPVFTIAERLIAHRKTLLPPWIQSGVVTFTQAIKLAQQRGADDIYIAKPHVFFPHDKTGVPAPAGQGLTYARHLWGSTIKSPWKYGDPVD